MEPLNLPTSWGFWSPCILLLPLFITINSLAARYIISLGNETDRMALLDIKLQIYDDPNGVLNSWNDSQHHCQWLGVTCNTRHQRVSALTLSGKSLSGTISPHIGNLSFMKVIHLEQNHFHGQIPQQFGHLCRLVFLNLSRNMLNGEIPVNLSNCSELRVIDLISNQLTGKFPGELGSLTKLETLYLAVNNLTGEVPSSLGNLSSLSRLSFAYNNLEGNLPEELGLLTSLVFLSMGANKLTGQIPPSLYNTSTLIVFSAPANFLYGSLPTNLALKLPNLQKIEIGGNHFSGEIPVSITNCTKLEEIDLGINKLEGKVPTNLGQLLNLQSLNLEGNSLGKNSIDDLDFLISLTNCSNLRMLFLSYNNFAGELSSSIGNLSSQLTELYLSFNKISGTIPVGLENLVNLDILSLADNSLVGVIPTNLGKHKNLEVLALGGNRLSGQIPSTLCNITNLFELNLSGNYLEGDLSDSFGSCQRLENLFISENNFSGIISSQIFGSYISLREIDLSSNSLSGTLPLEVGKLTNIQALDVSNNKLSGDIPATVGDCSTIEYLSMSNNHFSGSIPPLASLKSIEFLDLSNNNLTGRIPSDLNQLVYLKYLNLSYNDLQGEVPIDGIFGNVSQIILEGNSKLCGGIPELGLPDCSVVKRKKKGKHLKIIVIPLVLSATLICIILLLYFILHRKSDRFKEGLYTRSTKPCEKILRVSYQDLYRATQEFSSGNLIGLGSFGFVYKGRLEHHGEIKLVAVKVLDIQKSGASKSFKAECKALCNLRHRNLLSLLSYCSSIDFKGDEFKALVYKYMENGNLDKWLHPETLEKRSRNLNLLQRLNIAIDVALALDHLHNQSELPVAHCDLKPSNVLLDSDLTAHVGDFGLARLLPELVKNSVQEGTTSSSSIAIKGSIGYAAPEYAMGLEVSTQGDVYSFGILLLEMFTGKRPTDDTFVDGLDLHNYVETALPEQVWNVVDPLLLAREAEQHSQVQAAAEDEEIDNGEIGVENESGITGVDQTNSNMKERLISTFKIGLLCSQRSPNDRMDIKEVARELHHIRDAYCNGMVDSQRQAIHLILRRPREARI